MKKLLLTALFACGIVVGIEASPTDGVTQADLEAIISRLNVLEAENKVQAQRIAELEGKNRELTAKQAEVTKKVTAATVTTEEVVKKVAANAKTTAEVAKKVDANAKATEEVVSMVAAKEKGGKADKGTEISDSGRIYTTAAGRKYYLADATANIFEPLTESGLQFTPYGYLVLEGVYADRHLDWDWTTDVVLPGDRADQTTLSMQDSILGLAFNTPEGIAGWKFSGKAEFDLAGANQNEYAFHWRHLYVDAAHESGFSVLFGQTWHLFKIVSPNEIDGSWMEATGHPYRRSPQIRVTQKWDFEEECTLEARVGIVKGGPGMGGDRDHDNFQDNTASVWPLLEAALIFDKVAPWQEDGSRWLLGAAGMYGKDRSKRWTGDGYNGIEDEYASMMLLLAGKLPMGKFTLTGQAYIGQNVGGVQAGVFQTVLFDKYRINQKGDPVRTVGGFVDLAYQFTDDFAMAVGYGLDSPYNDDVCNSVSGGVTHNDRAYLAAFYNITSNFRVAAEYARLMTRYVEDNSDDDYDANRFQFSVFYDF